MTVTKYSRYRPDELEDLSLEELVQSLSDYFLASGYPSFQTLEQPDDHPLAELREAILNALLEQGELDPQTVKRMLDSGDNLDSSELGRLLDRISEWMLEQDYIRVSSPDPNLTASANPPEAAKPSESETRTTFELTNKTIDFLGFKSLRDLLAGLGKSSFGHHETKELATGVEVVGSSKPYEFGDTLNLDAVSTLLSALRRGK